MKQNLLSSVLPLEKIAAIERGERVEISSEESKRFQIAAMDMTVDQNPDGSLRFSEQDKEELDSLVCPLIRWLNEHCHPHVVLVVDPTEYQLSEGIVARRHLEFIKD